MLPKPNPETSADPTMDNKTAARRRPLVFLFSPGYFFMPTGRI